MFRNEQIRATVKVLRTWFGDGAVWLEERRTISEEVYLKNDLILHWGTC